MNDKFKGFWGFVRGVLTDGDVPSSSRVTLFMRCVVDCFTVVYLILCVVRGPLDKATLIVGALPLILGALGIWTTSTYITNRVTEIFKKPDPPAPPATGGQPGV